MKINAIAQHQQQAPQLTYKSERISRQYINSQSRTPACAPAVLDDPEVYTLARCAIPNHSGGMVHLPGASAIGKDTAGVEIPVSHGTERVHGYGHGLTSHCIHQLRLVVCHHVLKAFDGGHRLARGVARAIA